MIRVWFAVRGLRTRRTTLAHAVVNKPTPRDFFLVTTGCFVSGEELLADSQLARIASEDLAWHLTFLDWQSRAPRSVRTGGGQAWLAEHHAIMTERARIVAIARFYGVPD